MQLHKEGKEDEALSIYTQLVDENFNDITPYLNGASILRKKEQSAKAIPFIQKGLNIFPKASGLYNNMGNCLVDLSDDARAVVAYRQAIRFDTTAIDARISLVSCLSRLGLKQLAFKTAVAGYFTTPHPNSFITQILEALYNLPESQRGDSQELGKSIDQLESYLLSEHPDNPVHIWAVLCQVYISICDLDRALESRTKLHLLTTKTLQNNPGSVLKEKGYSDWHRIGWNLSLTLLRNGRLKEGWSLFDHGLLVAASGPQRWQRSLKKPYSSSLLPIWKGESLLGKKLLAIGEQGIGDMMMFATMLPSLAREASHITFCVPKRLHEIYKRSFNNISILSIEDLREKDTKPSMFDYQTAIGSICQYRFSDLDSHSSKDYLLHADPSVVQSFREKHYDGRPIVGISWQGGGKDKIIREKSIPLAQWHPILSDKRFKFISLQYGDARDLIERSNKKYDYQLIHDDSVDPLKDMDHWLSLVESTDYVISIANTTIHGAAGLNKPTSVLLNKNADWRWIEPSVYSKSYWYPDVVTHYQKDNGDWSDAIISAKNWLNTQSQTV